MAAGAVHDFRSEVVENGPVRTAKYVAEITFLYAVNGRDYRATGLSPGDKGFDDYYYAANKVELHPAGSTQVALVNPADASAAYLEPGSHLAAPVVGMVLFGIGALLFWRLWSVQTHPVGMTGAGKERAADRFLSVFILIGVLSAVLYFIPGLVRAIGGSRGREWRRGWWTRMCRSITATRAAIRTAWRCCFGMNLNG